jgi:excinuclease ABC subunit B
MDVDITETINELETEMLTAANNLEFEKAALLRDQIKELKRAIDGSQPTKQVAAPKPLSYRNGKRRS